MPTPVTRREPVKLSFRDGEVMVTPKDQDIFFISAQKATEACRDSIRQDERVARFTEEFLKPLSEWCRENAADVLSCYVLVPEFSVIPVFVVGSKEEYDFTLTERLSGLALWFEEHGWAVHASQIPR